MRVHRWRGVSDLDLLFPCTFPHCWCRQINRSPLQTVIKLISLKMLGSFVDMIEAVIGIDDGYLRIVCFSLSCKALWVFGESAAQQVPYYYYCFNICDPKWHLKPSTNFRPPPWILRIVKALSGNIGVWAVNVGLDKLRRRSASKKCR